MTPDPDRLAVGTIHFFCGFRHDSERSGVSVAKSTQRYVVPEEAMDVSFSASVESDRDQYIFHSDADLLTI